jgi:hypothetical protein
VRASQKLTFPFHSDSLDFRHGRYLTRPTASRKGNVGGVIKEEEAELLRAIADTLDCPIPPMVQI